METQDKSGKKEESMLEKIQGGSVLERLDSATEKLIKFFVGIIGFVVIIVVVIAIIKAVLKMVMQ